MFANPSFKIFSGKTRPQSSSGTNEFLVCDGGLGT